VDFSEKKTEVKDTPHVYHQHVQPARQKEDMPTIAEHLRLSRPIVTPKIEHMRAGELQITITNATPISNIRNMNEEAIRKKKGK